MKEVPLNDNAANQSLFVKTNGHTVFFRFATFRGMCFVDVEIDGASIVSGARVVQGANILPARYETMVGGNFMFVTKGGQYPFYSIFNGIDARLVFTGEDSDE